MNKKCTGCGAELQTNDETLEGYIKETNLSKMTLCERCFRIQNYNEYKMVDKTNKDFEKIFKKIDKSKDLVLLVVDLLNIGSIDEIAKYITNDIILVLTKRDLVPKNIYEEKLLNYFNKSKLNIREKIIISSMNNYNLDELMVLVGKHKKSNKVYVMGFTNAGKSTLINKLIYNYSEFENKITTSILPSTTLNSIEVELSEDLTIIDTPGLLTPTSIYDKVDSSTLRDIIPRKEIRPTVFQVKTDQVFIVNDLLRMDVKAGNDVIFYLSNALMVLRYYRDPEKLLDLEKHIIKVKGSEDIVIEGLGFVKIMKDTEVTIYTIKDVLVYTRKSFL